MRRLWGIGCWSCSCHWVHWERQQPNLTRDCLGWCCCITCLPHTCTASGCEGGDKGRVALLAVLHGALHPCGLCPISVQLPTATASERSASFLVLSVAATLIMLGHRPTRPSHLGSWLGSTGREGFFLRCQLGLSPQCRTELVTGHRNYNLPSNPSMKLTAKVMFCE